MSSLTVQRLQDEARIRGFLLTDPDYAAYALGDLEPPYAHHAAWFGAGQNGHVEALALIYDAVEPPVLFLMGATPALDALLAGAPFPDDVQFLCRPSDVPLVQRHYAVARVEHMLRMRLDRADFQPVEAPLRTSTLRRLGLSETPAMSALLKLAAAHDSRALEDIAFEPGMVEDGVYYGLHDGGELIAMAGTHLIARQAGFGALGNVVVHPDHRGQGLAKWASQAVIRALFAIGITTVVLNVSQHNEPAIRAYGRLGFETVSEFAEGIARRSAG